MRLPALAVLLALAGPLCAAAPPRDQAFYRERPLLEREKQEETDRDRRLAERRGVPYRQAEEAPGRRLTLDFSRPGKPTDNAFAESFNGKVRAECLNTAWFMSLDDARSKCEAWRRDYNEHRPHSAIGDKCPIELMNGAGPYGPPGA